MRFRNPIVAVGLAMTIFESSMSAKHFGRQLELPILRELGRVLVVMLSVSVCALFLGLGTGLVETMGRDPTLTGRTQIWHLVLSMTTNPLLGTGFESFWLGPRLQKIWSIYWWRPNEAHNAYIEVFLNLGWIGIALLAVLVTTGYQKVFNALRRDPDEGGLRLAYFVTALAYNCTESSIRIMHPVWIFFLFATVKLLESRKWK